jgi:hypothetical protein
MKDRVMSFAGLFGAIKRRWYVLVLGLMMTGALAVGATVVTPSAYTARGLVLLLPPTHKGDNPYLGLENLELPARVLATYFTSQPAQEQIKERSPKAEVAVSIDQSTQGPVIAIDVRDTTARNTLDVLDFVAGEMPVVLNRLQSDVGVRENIAVKSMPLTMDTKAVPDYKSVTRILIAVCLAGIAATAGGTYALDGLLVRRAATRSDPNLGREPGEIPPVNVDLPAVTCRSQGTPSPTSSTRGGPTSTQERIETRPSGSPALARVQSSASSSSRVQTRRGW